MSLSFASTAPALPSEPAVNLSASGNGDGNQVYLGEEEISDVTLATFYVFDKEAGDSTSSMVELVGHGGGCHGCGGCGHGGGATLVGAAEGAIMGVAVTAAAVAVMVAVAAVASASFSVAAAVAAVVAAEAIGAGSMGCEPGALILMAISFAARRRDSEQSSVRLVLA